MKAGQPGSGPWKAHTIGALIAVGFGIAAPVGAQERSTPELRFTAPASLAGHAERLSSMEPRRMAPLLTLLGLEDAGAPIDVILAEEATDTARLVPPWISGFARGSHSVVVLFPARIPSYPDPTLEGVLLHEVAHVLIARSAGHNPVPRWLNEGLAMIAGSPWDLADRTRVTLAMARRRPPSLAALDDLFAGGARQVRGAYALSGAFTQDLLKQHGSDTAARLLAGIASGLDFEVAFRRATGNSVAEAESSFWQRYTFWYRWVPVLTSSATLWGAITLLSLLAIRRRRERDRELRRQWEESESEPPEHNDLLNEDTVNDDTVN